MSQSLDRLICPARINGVELRNKLVCSPISTSSATTSGQVTQACIDFYQMMGRTGVGLVTIGATAVSPEGASTKQCMRIGPAEHTAGLRRLAREVKATGAAVSLQLFHVGSQGNTDYSGQPVVGPSPYVCPDIGIEVRPLRTGEVERIQEDMVHAVIVALDCGFDFVELHMAHGYLLHNFLSPFFNRRQDQYGGSAENRMRLISTIVHRIEEVRPGAMRRVGARLSGNDFLENGMTIEMNRPVVELFERFDAAYWVVSAGIYETAKLKYTHMRKGDYWRYSRELKSMTSMPVVAQGGVRTLEMGEDILERGDGDLVGMAQSLIADPGLVHKTLSGQEDAVVACTECRRCRYIRNIDWQFGCSLHDRFGDVRRKVVTGRDRENCVDSARIT